MPKVSVIIPVYNTEQYLRECLDSVINQTLDDIEIICINDGSTDGSLEILEEYAKKDSRIIIINESNKGAGVARETGVNRAVGEYLAFIDGDDFYLNDFLENMYHSATKNNSDIVICPVKIYNTQKKEYVDASNTVLMQNVPSFEPFCAKDIPDYIFTSFQNWNWNKIFKRNFIENNNIHFLPLHRTNDLYFTCCALIIAERITTVKKPLTVYRVGLTKNSQSTNHLHPFDYYNAFKKLRKFLKKRRIYNLYKQSYINWAINGCMYNIWTLRKHPKIQKKLIKLILTKGLKDLDLKSAKDVKPQYPNSFLKFIEISKKYKKERMDNIFSVKYENTHKVITVLGVKIKKRLS